MAARSSDSSPLLSPYSKGTGSEDNGPQAPARSQQEVQLPGSGVVMLCAHKGSVTLSIPQV